MKLNSLLRTLDPSGMFELDNDAQEQLLALANDFSNSLIHKSMRVAKHRHRRKNQSNSSMDGDGKEHRPAVVEVEDVSIVLRKDWGITIPGLSSVADRPVNYKGRRGLTAGKILGSSSSSSNVNPASSTYGVDRTENGKRKQLEGDDANVSVKKINTTAM